MILMSYRVRGSDASWRAGIAHEGAVVDANSYQVHRKDDALGQGEFSVRELLK